MPDFDVAIVGSGPGGYVAAIRAAQLGLKVALVEKDGKFGGTCLHRGCIPTKAMLHDAALYASMKHAGRYGVKVSGVELDFPAVRKHKELVVKKLATGVEGLLKKNKIKTLHGFGKLVKPGVLDVSGKTLSAKAILLATGSRPKGLPGLEPDGGRILTSDDALELKEVPESLAVVGAGAVGVEFASIYSRFGSAVTLIEIMPHVLPLEDEEVSAAFAKALQKRGVRVRTGAKVGAVGRDGTLEVDAGGKREEVRCEKILVAAGRAPNTEGIGLEGTRARLERGFVQVDDFMQTDEPGLYAIGDIVPRPQLAHVASAQGILVAERLAGKEVNPIDYDRIPSVAYSDPQVASVGLTERAARERGEKIACGKFPFMASGKATVDGDHEGFVKIVAGAEYGEILGVHILHAHAGEMVSSAVDVLNGELTAEDLARCIHPHPTLSEALVEAAHAIFGRAIHI